MKDDWRPQLKTRAKTIRTVRDKNGNPWHYDHNEKKWVEGMWSAKAKLKAVKNS